MMKNEQPSGCIFALGSLFSQALLNLRFLPLECLDLIVFCGIVRDHRLIESVSGDANQDGQLMAKHTKACEGVMLTGYQEISGIACIASPADGGVKSAAWTETTS